MGRLRPRRALLLARAGLDGISGSDGMLTIGATTPVARLADEAPEPLATFARHVGDPEIRAQATVGGNLCAPPALASQRGDLQAPLLAMGAQVRTAGAGGERVDALDDFLASAGDGRLLLAVEVEEPQRGSTAAVGRPHAHSYTVLAVACAETSSGGVRVAVGGAGPRALRLQSVEQALAGGASPADAAARATEDVQPQDDALASAAYRKKVLPLLVERALNEL
jgi:carbon-monoxide dehydrogenase medium subunit